MKIFNIMLSRGLGGIQQSFLDYTKALSIEKNHKIISIVSTKAVIEPQLTSSYYCLSNFCSFDPISIIQLINLLNREKPQLIIVHGNRAINFTLIARKFSKINVKIIGVAHNYSYKKLVKCDYIFAITNHLKNFLIDQKFSVEKIFILPNMIDSSIYIPLIKLRNIDGPIVIGCLGRFVAKKGIDDFIKALSILKHQQISFKAIIGGNGEEYNTLVTLTKKLHLDDNIEFVGWVDNKMDFFNKIDVFCLPSKHEPFGIILLEVMLAKKAIISTTSEGPREILTHNKTALLTEVASPVDLADKIKILIENQRLRLELAENASLYVQDNYDINVISKTLSQHLTSIK